MGKRALVISGGGSRGSFAVGALKYLMGDLGLEFDILAGTSTGSLITPMLAAQGGAALPLLEKQYTTVYTRDIVKKRGILSIITGAPSLMDSAPLLKRINGEVTPEIFAQIQQSGRRLFITTVDMKSGLLVFHTIGEPPANDDPDVRSVPVRTREQLIQAMYASASIPSAMQPVDIGGALYVDGGVRDYAAVDAAIDAGATDICCLVLAPAMKYRPDWDKMKPDLIQVVQRATDLMSEEIGAKNVRMSQLYTNSAVYIDAVKQRLVNHYGFDRANVDLAFQHPGVPNPFENKRAVSLRVIRPEKMLVGDTLKFDPPDMIANMKYGFECAKTQWAGTKNLRVSSIFADLPAPV